MRFKWLSEYWTGLVTSLSLVIISLWLAVHGRLDLYIHPRYIWFTVLLCAVALVCILADLATRKNMPKTVERTRIGGVAAGLLGLAFCAALVILKPTTLTSLAADQRGINTAALTVSTSTTLADLSSVQADSTQFSLKEWAALLAQSNDSELFSGKAADVSGFVTPATSADPNVFYVSRFVITCCAVDARPLGVPVYKPGWQQQYKADQWLEVQGSFMPNPAASELSVVLLPKTITPIAEPDEPYAY
jgi:putative membrane protein